jgi:Fic family protein
MRKYIWQLPNWTSFTWDEKALLPILSQIKLKQGMLVQQLNTLLSDDLTQTQAIILEQETIHTAAIEGEKYNAEMVRSSIHKRLNLSTAGLPHPDRHIDGLLDVIIDATGHPNQKLTLQRLFSWHASLFPTGYSRLLKISVAKLRNDLNGPMQVVSGNIGHEKIHFEAPGAEGLKQEMKRFLSWWTDSQSTQNGIIRAGIAHFYFVTIHPFDDGNGRIARVLADLALAQDDAFPHRYYSMSQAILSQKKDYYDILEKAQKGNQDLTPWLLWFTKCLLLALDNSSILLQNIFTKTSFWQKHYAVTINDRQRKVINKILDLGQDNFIGGLTTRKYVNMNHGISRRTAVREIQDLVSKGILTQNAGLGRSISYNIAKQTT